MVKAIARLLGVLLAGLAASANAANAPESPGLAVGPGDLRVVVGEQAAAPERCAVDLFVAEVRRRTGVPPGLGDSASARYSLLVGTPETSKAIRAYVGKHPEAAELGRDGYHLMARPEADRCLYLVGQGPGGVVAGIGKLLRLLRYREQSLFVPAVTLSESPRLPIRGIYFATHFNNFYHVAPLQEIDAVIEDFALWGGNSLTVWFDMHHFKGLEEPAAQTHLSRLRHMGETAHRLGVQFGLAFLANEAYNTSPQELRAQWRPGWSHYHVELCPSKPEGLALIGRWQDQELGAFSAVDFIWTWPYDQGGCACGQCMPWGAKGFLRASEQLARLYRQRFPQGKVWLSTWLFDSQAGCQGDYAGLFQFLRDKQPRWLDGIVADTGAIPHRLPERPLSERYPLTCFPEISMYQMGPWGGYGANPLPTHCARCAQDVRGRVQGGWPYSEGIYEDLNKFFWVQADWSPDRPTDDILAEYASYYLGPESSSDAVRLFHLLEASHPRMKWRVRNLAPADEAGGIAKAIDAQLPAWAKTSWRWRLLFLRAMIDQTLKDKGYMSAEAQSALKPFCDELVQIYHAASTFIRPPPFPRQKTPNDLAFGCPVVVSSTHPECAGSARMLTDGALAQEDPQNFWAHDPAKEKTAQVVVDLRETRQVKEVRLQFRQIFGKFWFIPASVRFEVSQDGKRYEQVMDSHDVPKEGADYSPTLWAYKIGMKARYLRLTLGPSQHVGAPYAGMLELTEIEVSGP